MRHDLNAINTAIALGDNVIPPGGSEVIVNRFGRQIEGTVIHTTNLVGLFYVMPRYGSGKPGDLGIFINSYWPFKVLSVPKYAPSFDKWERHKPWSWKS